MKILKAQDALLSNYEVYEHLIHVQNAYQVGTTGHEAGPSTKMPDNLAKTTTDVLQYLRTHPSPLHNQDINRHYSFESIALLMERLHEANFSSEITKGELLSILNLRPANTAVLDTVIENMQERFHDEEQNKIVEIVAEVLGQDEQAAEEKGGYDES